MEQNKRQFNSVHLSIVIMVTLSGIAMTVVAHLLGWELWFPPFLLIGVVCCWIIFLKNMFTEKERLWFYAIVVWMMMVYHGVQPASMFDLAAVTSIVLMLFAQTDHRRLLGVTMYLYLFCLLRQLYLAAFTDRAVFVLDAENIPRIILHLFIVGFVCWLGVSLIKKRAEDRRTDEREIVELREIQKRTEDFLANVSHELRTPINAALGLGGIMLQEAESGAEKEQATEIVRAARRLSEQIGDMLDYTEIDAGKLQVTKESYTVAVLLREVIRGLDLQKMESLPDLLIGVDNELPEQLLGDERVLRKILLHLMENAVRHTPQGSVTLRLFPEAAEEGILLCAEVRDTGAGMSEEVRQRALEGQYRSEEERGEHAQGLGLGFPIITGLLRAVDGRMDITSAEGEGTCVLVRVPQEVPEAPTEALPRRLKELLGKEEHPWEAWERALSDNDKTDWSGVRVLVVDDEPMNLLVAESIFGAYGMEVQTAESGAEAVRRVGEELFDIIFMDHMMPEMDGVEAMRRIRELQRAELTKTPVVALTANAVSGAREMLLSEGFDEFVAKPVERHKLERVLRLILGA